MARQPHHPDIMAEIFAAELRADAQILGQFENLGLKSKIAEGMAVLAARDRQGNRDNASRRA